MAGDGLRPLKVSCSPSAFSGQGLLLYALLADPSYGYFGLMKYGVLGCSLYVAWALHGQNPKLAPLSLALGALGLFEFFGKMHREQWAPWNWVMVGAFGAAAGALLLPPPKTLAELQTELAETEERIGELEAAESKARAEAVFADMKEDADRRRAAGEFEGRDFAAERAAILEDLKKAFGSDEPDPERPERSW